MVFFSGPPVLNPPQPRAIEASWRMPEWGRRLLITFLTSNKRPMIQAACKTAGISRDTF